MDIVRFEDIESRITIVSGQQALLDSDVAVLYGIETKRVNEAVKNNPEKFPDGYIILLTKEEWTRLKSKISTSKKGGKQKLPQAFTEKGLYMLATILKSDKATATTIGIIETFSKIRKLANSFNQLSSSPNNADKKQLIAENEQILMDLLGDNLKIDGTETTIEFNFAVFKIKHKINRKQK